MSFFRRIARVFASDARGAGAGRDDPAQSVATAYDEHLGLWQNVRAHLAEVLTAQKKLEMRAAVVARSGARDREEALAALRADDEERARRAIRRANLSAEQHRELQAEIAAVHATFLTVEGVAEELRVRTDAIRHEKEIVAAKVAVARASIGAHGALGGFGPEMERIRALLTDARDRTQSLEARAAALDELLARGSFERDDASVNDAFARRIREATSDAAVDAALVEIRPTALGS